MCLDPHYNIRPGHCLVLSFGVGDDWAFEDEVAAFGCRVSIDCEKLRGGGEAENFPWLERRVNVRVAHFTVYSVPVFVYLQFSFFIPGPGASHS